MKLTKEKREAKAAKFRETMAKKREAKLAAQNGKYPASFEGEAKSGKKGKTKDSSNAHIAMELLKLAVRILEGR